MSRSPFGVVSTLQESPSYCSCLGSALFTLSILPFLKYIFPQVLPVYLMGSAVSCGGATAEPAGTGMVQLLVYSHRRHPCSTLAAEIMLPTPSTISWVT